MPHHSHDATARAVASHALPAVLCLVGLAAASAPRTGEAGSPPPLQAQFDRALVTLELTDTPDPSMPGEPVVVQWSVTPVAPGAGTPTGTVRVLDEVGVTSCEAPVATGQ